jgi:hypothetical protein
MTPALAGILRGGAIAGVLDIAYAILYGLSRSRSATSTLQSVASGLLGRSAYDAGLATAALGLILHFFNAMVWAALFVLASRRLPALTRYAVPAGILYGIVVFVGMYFVVLPLSAFPHKLSFPPAMVARNLAVHMFLIGLPIALAARTARREGPGNADMPVRAAAIWLALLVLAVANGAFRQAALDPGLGPMRAHPVSTLLLCVVILAVTALTIRWIGPKTAGQAWTIGIAWVTATLAFELLGGHYLFGRPWNALLADYALTAGRIWPLVLVTILVAPVWAERRLARRGVQSSA